MSQITNVYKTVGQLEEREQYENYIWNGLDKLAKFDKSLYNCRKSTRLSREDQLFSLQFLFLDIVT